MNNALTLTDLKAVWETLPPAPDEMCFYFNPESRSRHWIFFQAFEEANKPTVFGITPIPVQEQPWLPLDWGVLRNVTKETYSIVRYEQ